MGLSTHKRLFSRLRAVSISVGIAFSFAQAGLAQVSNSTSLPPRMLLTNEEVKAQERHVENERYWWVAIQTHAWEDCMASKGYDPTVISYLAENEVRSILGATYDRAYFSGSRKIGFHRAVFPLLDANCHLPNDSDIQQRAYQAAVNALRLDADRMDRYVKHLKEENDQLRQDNALQEAIRSAPFCAEAVNKIANYEKSRLHSVGRPLERALGYSAADLTLDDMIARQTYKQNRCRPILRPMPPAGF